MIAAAGERSDAMQMSIEAHLLDDEGRTKPVRPATIDRKPTTDTWA
jgi:hypothetical protein